MNNFVRILIDSDPEKKTEFKIMFDMGDFTSITVDFRKNRKDCINLSVAELTDFGYADAKRLLQSVLSHFQESKE